MDPEVEKNVKCLTFPSEPEPIKINPYTDDLGDPLAQLRYARSLSVRLYIGCVSTFNYFLMKIVV